MQFEISYLRSSGDLAVKDIINFCRSRNSIFQLLNCSSLISEEQVRIAMDLMDQIREKVNIEDAGILLMLLLAGTNQIKTAEEKVGISRGNADYLCIYSNANDLKEFLESFNSFVRIEKPLLPEKYPQKDPDLFMNFSRARLMLLTSSAI